VGEGVAGASASGALRSIADLNSAANPPAPSAKIGGFRADVPSLKMAHFHLRGASNGMTSDTDTHAHLGQL
jgi:hypothetical protein